MKDLEILPDSNKKGKTGILKKHFQPGIGKKKKQLSKVNIGR